jgi:hypothetical protein
MADLSYIEKRHLEKILGMGSGYVLDFSNRTFEEFVVDSTGKNIYDEKYSSAGGSKANRLRAFWDQGLAVGIIFLGQIFKSINDNGC